MGATHFSGPVSSSNGFTGDVTGNVTGNLTGAVTGTTVSASTSLTVGSGTAITKMLRFSKSVVVSALAAADEEEYTLTCSGVAVGDSIIVNPPNAAAEAGLGVILAWVSAADTVKVRASNFSTGALTGSTSNWDILAIRS